MSPGAKLRTMADALQAEIDAKFADRQSNTPKRQRQAAEARHEGARLQRTQQAMRVLADLHERGAVPPELRELTTKSKIFDLCRPHIDRTHAGYYDAGIDTGQPAIDAPAARALWQLLAAPSAEERRAAELRAKADALKFANIPGYFQTPAAIVDRMIAAAEIPEGSCTILEPSAGSGAILDRLRPRFPLAKLSAYERHQTLRDVLALKGYALDGSDFLDAAPAAFDRILMNPPFEAGQDMAHVRRAFAMLKPGGRLVAIISPGPFFRADTKARAFRDWFDDCGGERVDLPAGSFKESGTGAGAVMVTIDAPASAVVASAAA